MTPLDKYLSEVKERIKTSHVTTMDYRWRIGIVQYVINILNTAHNDSLLISPMRDIDKLVRIVEAQKEALKSIACEQSSEQVHIEHWLTVEHVQCARTLAKDTSIARHALSNADEIAGEK